MLDEVTIANWHLLSAKRHWRCRPVDHPARMYCRTAAEAAGVVRAES